MTAYLLVNHLLNFVAPAACVALLLVTSSRLLFGFFKQNKPLAHSWYAQLAIIFIVGVLVSVVGLVAFGRDGKMLTYAALVLASGTTQWLVLRGWKL